MRRPAVRQPAESSENPDAVESLETPVKLTPEQQELVAAHFGLVRQAAYWMRNVEYTTFDVEEAIGYGAEGLCNAARTFNPTLTEMPFETFAWRKIRFAIIDGGRKLAHVNRQTGKAQEFSVLHRTANSLDHGILDNGAGTYHDILADDSRSPEEIIVAHDAREEETQLLLQGLAGLNDKQRAAIIGWANGVPMKEIAEQLGLTESRISQLRKEAIERIRKNQGVTPRALP